MKKWIQISGAVLVCCLWTSLLVAATTDEIKQAISKGAEGKITLRVVDTKGDPVVGAQVGVGFFNQNMKGDGEGVSGKTDLDGLFMATGEPTGDMSYGIAKEGYYRTEGSYWFYRANDPNTVKDGHWEPWNPTNTVVLKEKRNPVPMFATQLKVLVPVWNKPVGFDLGKADLVAPYGKGVVPDVYLTYSASQQDVFNYSNQIVFTFSNRLDGFCRLPKDEWSEFKSAYEAPTNGYQNELVLCKSHTTFKVLQKKELSDSEYLVFRVRTVVDAQGNIVNAQYGKLDGGLGQHKLEFGRFDTDGKSGGFICSYYFNPDGTRNLEFDPKKNLFKNLKPLE